MTVDKNLLDDLQKRGLINQTTSPDELAEHLSSVRTLYDGFDPTADSLHIGSLVQLLTLRRFQLAGHKVIALVGGATGFIGDPSFKAQERKLNSADIVEDWTEKLRTQVSRFIDMDNAEVVNNMDWISKIDVITFLRDVGKHFSVNAMMNKEAVKSRLEREETGISYTEFSYALLQALDYAELYKTHNCTIQVGGSDQWGNITAGIDLTRRVHNQQVFGITLPLVTKADGTKFGKTETGTIWLDSKKTSVYTFYQFWLNTIDADVEKFLKIFTFLPVEEIEEIAKAHMQAPEKRVGQKLLAQEVTRLVHGDEGVKHAEHLTAVVFSSDDDKWQKLSEHDLEQLQQDGLPATELTEPEMPILTALSTAGLATSNRQAREFIDAGAVKINGRSVPAKEYNLPLDNDNALFGRFTVLQVGKKKTHLMYWAA